MKVAAIICVSFLFWCVSQAQDSVLVLTNAQTIEITGSYEIKGNYVVFTDAYGELSQLPKKLIDFAATERTNTERATQKVVAVADEETGERNFSSVSRRLDSDQHSESISLGDNDLNRFARTHHGNSSDQQEEYEFDSQEKSEEPASPATTDLHQLQRSLKQELVTIDAKIMQLDVDIQKREDQVIANSLKELDEPYRNEKYEIDRGGGFHTNEIDDLGMEIPDTGVGVSRARQDSQVKRMQQERAKLVKQREAIIAEARNAGIRNLR